MLRFGSIENEDPENEDPRTEDPYENEEPFIYFIGNEIISI